MPSKIESVEQDLSLPRMHAVDTTFLLAANSALFPTQASGLRDKEHDVALKRLLTYLCNGRDFHYVRPKATEAITSLTILNLLKSSTVHAKTVGLTPEGTEENYRAAVEDFCNYLEFSRGGDVVDWVRFQFDDDDLVQVFFDGGEDEQIGRLLTARTYLKDSPRFTVLSALWEKAGGANVLLRGKHSRVARREFASILEYSATYAFFGFAKGQFYPLQLADDLRHCLHWLREIAIEKLQSRLGRMPRSLAEQSIVERADPPDTGLCFEWGSILLELAKRDERLRAPEPLSEMVAVLRAETRPDALAEIIAAGSKKTGNEAEEARRKACEDFVLRVLLKTSWEPVPTNEKAYTRRGKAIINLLAGIAMAAPMGAALGPMGALGGFLGGIAVSGATLVDLAVDSRWYLRTEFRATRRFAREKLFHRFSRTAIGPAVEEFLRRAARQVQLPVSPAVFDHYGSRLRMSGSELHSALKTEVVGSTSSQPGVRLLLVRLQNSKTAFFHSLHAVPHEYSTAGLQTTDCLAYLGFIRSSCPFAHSECYVLRVGDEFNLKDFSEGFGTYCTALKHAEQHLRACGIGLDQPEGWGFFMGKPSGGPRIRLPFVAGDGHSSPQSERLKEAEDDLFRYVLSWIEGGADKGWTLHYRPKDGAVSPEVSAAFSFLGGFRRQEECPAFDFEFCYWRFIPFERRGDSPGDSNVDFVHSGFEAHNQHYAPGLHRIVDAHSAVAPQGIHLLAISQLSTVAIQQGQKSAEASLLVEEKLGVPQRRMSHKFNFFISYASEDQDLAEALDVTLSQRGYKVWRDKGQRTLGDSLMEKISEGLTASRYAIVILSKAFIRKNWPRAELYALQARAIEEGQKVILPVRRDLDHEEMARHFPLLGDKLTVSFTNNLRELVSEIEQVVKPVVLEKLNGG